MLGGAVAADAAALRKFFNRFKKDEMVELVAKLDLGSRLGDETTATIGSMAKGAVVSAVVNCFGSGITYDEIAKVDMLYFQQRNGGRKWQTMKLVDAQAADSAIASIKDPAALAKQLSASLGFFFAHHLTAVGFGDAIWVRLFVQDSADPSFQLTSNSNTMYCIYLPHSPYILVTAMKKSHRDYVSQAFVSTFKCTRLEEIELSGKDASSLADMLLNQQSQGKYGDYRLGHHDSNPLSQARPQPKRKRTEPDSAWSGRIVVEDPEKDQRRSAHTDAAFGQSDNPKLQKAEFQLLTQYRGDSEYEVPGVFKCKVKFEGPSIVDGLKQLVSQGMAETPLPAFLANLHSSAQNSFKIEDSDVASA